MPASLNLKKRKREEIAQVLPEKVSKEIYSQRNIN